MTSSFEASVVAAEPPVNLDEQLCFALYAAARAVIAVYRAPLERIGLTYPQFLVLIALGERARTVGDLGLRLHLDYGTLTPLLKRIESAGFVSRTRRADDERSVEVRLTAAGNTALQAASAVPERVRSVLGLPPGRYEDLRDGLRGISATLATMNAEANADADVA